MLQINLATLWEPRQDTIFGGYGPGNQCSNLVFCVSLGETDFATTSNATTAFKCSFETYMHFVKTCVIFVLFLTPGVVYTLIQPLVLLFQASRKVFCGDWTGLAAHWSFESVNHADEGLNQPR